MLEELSDRDADLVGGALPQRRETPALDEPFAVEHAQHDVGVSDVDGQQHRSTLDLTLPTAPRPQSPAPARSPTRTIRAPVSSMSSTRPRRTPDGESHSITDDHIGDARRRQALRIASNLPATKVAVSLGKRRQHLAEDLRSVRRTARFGLDARRPCRQVRGKSRLLKIDAHTKDDESRAFRRSSRPQPECLRAFVDR